MDFTNIIHRLLSETLKFQRTYERYIQSSLRNSLTTMKGEMSDFYSRWSVNGKISLVQLEKYGRYSRMEKTLTDILNPELSSHVRKMKTYVPEQYLDMYYRTAWAMESSLGASGRWGLINKNTAIQLYSITNANNKLLAEALSNYSYSARKKVRQALFNGLTLGKNFSSMASDLSKAMKITGESANRIIRTEGMGAINAGIEAAYLKAIDGGLSGKIVWSAILDQKVRPDHAAMEGKVKEDDGFFRGPGAERAKYPGWEGLSAGQRINCRCIEVFKADGKEPNPVNFSEFDEWRAKLLGGKG